MELAVRRSQGTLGKATCLPLAASKEVEPPPEVQVFSQTPRLLYGNFEEWMSLTFFFLHGIYLNPLVSKVISSWGVPLSKTRTVTENRTTFPASSNEVTLRDKAGPGSHEAEEAAVSHHRECETEGSRGYWGAGFSSSEAFGGPEPGGCFHL